MSIMENDFLNEIKGELKAYGESLGQLGQLRLVGIVSRILGLFLLILTVVLLVFALLTISAVACIDALAVHMPLWAASLIIGAVYLLLLVVAVVCRRTLFINPFIKLMLKQVKSEDELAIKSMEAAHKAEIQRIRLETRVDNVTREWSLYTTLLSRAWNFIAGKLKR